MADGGATRRVDSFVPGQDSFLGRAVRLLEQHRFAAAEATCKAVLSHDPVQRHAQLVLGLSLGAQGEADGAATWLDRVARARPHEPHPCHALTSLLQDIARADRVVPQYRACLRLAPFDGSLRHALAEQLYAGGAIEQAHEALAPVLLAASPPLASLMLAGMVLAELGRHADAIASFRAVVARDPAAAAGWTNLGMLLKIEGRFDEAAEASSRAVALRPDDPQIRLNRAMVLLRAGRLAEAWDDYDARLALPGRAPLPPEQLLRDLDQLRAGGNARVLVLHDCGFGDTLHFIRFAAALAARGAVVIAWVPGELARLVGRVPGVAEVAPADAPPPAYDLHCHATDLPRICRTTVESIPSAAYLFPEPARIAHWRGRLSALRGLRIGLAWAGQKRPWMPGFDALDNRRSTTLTQFMPLARVPGSCLVSLQKGPEAAQSRSAPPGMVLHDFMEEATDFAETAALIANLDAVVTVDTSVAHLAGGMGARVLLLDRYDGCWRWFHGREDSPWYPGMRILRQEAPGEWGPVVRRAAELVGNMADGRG